MKEKIRKYKLASVCSLISLVLVIGGWAWAFGVLHGITEPLILHFNPFSGINQVGSIWDLLNFAVLGIIVIVVNFFIAIELEQRDWFLGKFLVMGTLFMSILLFIGFAVIINVN